MFHISTSAGTCIHDYSGMRPQFNLTKYLSIWQKLFQQYSLSLHRLLSPKANSPLQVEHKWFQYPNLCPSVHYTHPEWVHNTVGQGVHCKVSWPTVVLHYASKMCDTLQDLNVLITWTNRLYSFIQWAFKHSYICLGPGDLSPKGLTSLCSAKTFRNSVRITVSMAKTSLGCKFTWSIIGQEACLAHQVT